MKALILFLFCSSLIFRLSYSDIISRQSIKANISLQQNESSSENCTELFPRLFFVNVTADQLGYITMNIKFNTQDQCSSSYIYIQQPNIIRKHQCREQIVNITQNKTFIQYIHTCPIKINAVDYDTFEYSCYGQGKNKYNQFRQIPTYKVNIPKPTKQLSIISIADWGPIRTVPIIPVYPMLNEIRKSNSFVIHALMIVGDIAYDLSTNQCQQFVIFMTQLSQVSPYWPIIPIVGNHEGLQPNRQIFFKNFQAPGLTSVQRIHTFDFWNMQIISFDPTLEIYDVSTQQKKRLMFDALKNQLNKEADFRIVTSHYPLQCSPSDDIHCGDTMKKLPQFFKYMSQSKKVDFYIGAHMHQYERVYPLINNQFVKKQSPYKRGQMVSVVEGIGGCQLQVTDQPVPQYFSVKHVINNTGFGLMTLQGFQRNQIEMKFEQYLTVPHFKIFDQIIISGVTKKFKDNLRLEDE